MSQGQGHQGHQGGAHLGHESCLGVTWAEFQKSRDINMVEYETIRSRWAHPFGPHKEGQGEKAREIPLVFTESIARLILQYRLPGSRAGC